MDVDISQWVLRKDARAGFSAYDDIPAKVTRTCPYGTSVSNGSVLNPFGYLATIIGSWPVEDNLRTIRGSKSRSYRSPTYSTTDSATWLFKAVS
jgi:hypothetical protein